MTNYRIYVKADKNLRTVNTPANGRTNYDIVEVLGNRADLKAKVEELQANGVVVDEIHFGACGGRVYLFEL